MKLIFVYGPPAAGKYTVASKVSELTGLPLFHNHLVVDAVASVFPFGSDRFVRLREHFWMSMIEAACAEGRSIIFTFQPEASVSPDFADNVARLVREAGGLTIFVHLALSAAEQQARVANVDRGRFGKLRSVELLRSLQPEFEACERAMPAPDILIDTGRTSPEMAAEQICKAIMEAD